MQKISEIVFPEFNLSLDLITYKSSQIKDIKQIDKSYPRIHSIIKTDLEYLRNLENEQRRAHAEKKKRGQLLRDRDEDSDI